MSQLITFDDGTYGTVITITGDVGGAVSPDGAGNIGLVGSDIVTVTGTPGTSSLAITVSDALKTDTGFSAWTGAGNYFDDTVVGTFQLLRGGSGYINGKLIEFIGPQSTVGLVTGELYWIYIDSTGTIQKTTTRTNDLYKNNIILFQCARDSTLPVNVQITAKENHSFSYPVDVRNYNNSIIGTVIENAEQGANITLNGTQKIQINGADTLTDEGLDTAIVDSAGVAETFFQLYTLATGKWAVYANSDTFTGYYNNAGTPTVLGGTKYGVYTLYVGKDSLNVATPRYVAVLDDSEYSNLTAAQTAIANGTTAITSGGLKGLELAMLGYIIYKKSTDTIVDVIINKATLKQTTSTGGTNIASLVTTNTTNFDGILSVGDTNVQAALDTIDEWQQQIEVIGAAQSIAVNKKYLANNAGLVTLTLPLTAAVGDMIEIIGSGAGGWIIAQNAGQVIHFVVSDTTIGVGGSIASTERYDVVRLMCNVTDNEFVVVSSMGNITVV